MWWLEVAFCADVVTVALQKAHAVRRIISGVCYGGWQSLGKGPGVR